MHIEKELSYYYISVHSYKMIRLNKIPRQRFRPSGRGVRSRSSSSRLNTSLYLFSVQLLATRTDILLLKSLFHAGLLGRGLILFITTDVTPPPLETMFSVARLKGKVFTSSHSTVVKTSLCKCFILQKWYVVT